MDSGLPRFRSGPGMTHRKYDAALPLSPLRPNTTSYFAFSYGKITLADSYSAGATTTCVDMSLNWASRCP